MLCNICNSHMHLCAYLLENVPPLQDSKPMHIWGNRPWGSTSTPQLCKAFFKEPIGRFWGKLWISITSHQFLAWSWQNSYVLANHTHPFHPIFHLLQLLVGQLWWCKGGGGAGWGPPPWCYNKTSTSLEIMGSRMPRDIYGCGIGNWWCGGAKTYWHLSTFWPCPQLRMLGMFHHPNPKYKWL
jgi:hypothetical protein